MTRDADNINREYIASLTTTAIALTMQATEARRRGVDGLAAVFTEASEMVATWCGALSEDPHWIPDTTGDLEPTGPGETALPVQFSPGGVAEITGDGMRVPPGASRVQLVKQPDGNYGLRFMR